MATITVTMRVNVDIEADDLLEYKTDKEEKIAQLEDMGFTVKVESEDGVHELGAPDHDDDGDDDDDDDDDGYDDEEN